MEAETGKRLIKLMLSPERTVNDMNEAVDLIMSDVLDTAAREAETRQRDQTMVLFNECMRRIEALQREQKEREAREEKPCEAHAKKGTCGKCKEAAGDNAKTGAAKRQQAVQISRICKSCGKEFKAGSGAALYCPECKENVKTASKDVTNLAKELVGMD